MFCPKCGAILIPKKDNNKKILACSCGYKSKDVSQAKIKEVIKKDDKEIEVVDRDEMETLPLTDVECPKCGNKKAYYWLVQTRASDEAETKFLKCAKCKYTWRDYN
jgi:DNA-directed RNA polymerase subunit M